MKWKISLWCMTCMNIAVSWKTDGTYYVLCLEDRGNPHKWGRGQRHPAIVPSSGKWTGVPLVSLVHMKSYCPSVALWRNYTSDLHFTCRTIVLHLLGIVQEILTIHCCFLTTQCCDGITLRFNLLYWCNDLCLLCFKEGMRGWKITKNE